MEYQIDRRENDRENGRGKAKGKSASGRATKWVGRQRERERGFVARARPVSLDAQNGDAQASADAAAATEKKMTVLTKRKSVIEVDMAGLDRLLDMDANGGVDTNALVDTSASAKAKMDAMGIEHQGQGPEQTQLSRGSSSTSTIACMVEFDGLALGGNAKANSSQHGHAHVHAYSHGAHGSGSALNREMNRDRLRASSIPPVPLFHPSANATTYPQSISEICHQREDVEPTVLASSLPLSSHMLASAHGRSSNASIGTNINAINGNQQQTYTSTCTRSSTHSSSEHSCTKKIKCDNPNLGACGDPFDERFMMRHSMHSSRDDEDDEDEEDEDGECQQSGKGRRAEASTKTPPQPMQTTSPLPPSSIASTTAKKITESFHAFDLGPRDLSDSSLSHVLHLEFEDVEKQGNRAIEHELDAASSSSGSFASPNESTTENHGIRGFLSWEALDQMMENREVKETVGKENEYFSSVTTTMMLDADPKGPASEMGTGFK